jgi:hypothetical protein
MCTFTAIEPVTNASAKTFASAIMKTMLQYGTSHTVVLDKDSKFLEVCRESLDLLHINCHILLGGNHNPMLVERVNCYLSKGLNIMTNECNSIRVALEAILLLIYAWNSCPVPGTDIWHRYFPQSCCCRMQIPISHQFLIRQSCCTHFRAQHSQILLLSPCQMSQRLPQSCIAFSLQVALLALRTCQFTTLQTLHIQYWQHRLCPPGYPFRFKMHVVDKLMYAFTGPWCVTASLPGASYELQHVHSPTSRNKKHALDLSLYPVELIPFQPPGSADTCYGQLYKPIGHSPFKEARLKGFQPFSPFKVPSHLLQASHLNEFHWPTLSELNNNILQFPCLNKGECRLIMDGNHPTIEPILYNRPTPSPAINAPPTIPPISSLVTSILSSSGKLFFISHLLGNPNIREWRLVRVAFCWAK